MGWHQRAPKTKAERLALKKRCGDRAFLQPRNLKFPIMAKSGPCEIDCVGLKAAQGRATQTGRRVIAVRARKLRTKARCSIGR